MMCPQNNAKNDFYQSFAVVVKKKKKKSRSVFIQVFIQIWNSQPSMFWIGISLF